VDLNQLFLSNHFGYGSSVLGPNDDLSLSLGPIHWILGLLALILAVINYKKIKKTAVIIFVLFFITLAVTFLMHQKSSFIWEKLPTLRWLQFPWRFLSITGFMLSFLGALVIYLATRLKRSMGIVLGVMVILAVFILHVSFFQPKAWLSISEKKS